MATTYQTQADQIKRRRLIAESLRQSGNEALPASIRTSGRLDAKVSGWEHANKALQQLLGGYMSGRADKDQSKLDEQDEQALADLIAAKREADAPDMTTGQADPTDPDAVGPVRMPTTQESPAVRQQKLQAAVLRGQQFGGQAGPVAGELLQREILPTEQAPYTLGENDVRYDKSNQPVAAGLPRAPRELAEDRQLIEVVDPTQPDGKRTIKREDWQNEDLWHPPKSDSSGSAGPVAEPLTLDAVRDAAMNVIRDPKAMSQYAVGNSKDAARERNRINNETQKIMREAGMTNNQVAQFRGRVQGELKSQKAMVDMGNAVASYKFLARANGDRILQLVEGVDVTGVPAIEGLIRKGKVKLGSEDAAEFQSILKTYQTEVARIISQPRLVGQLTDTQIQEMEKVVDGSASAPQLRRVIGRLNIEMDLRQQGIENQVAASGAQLNIPGMTPTPTAAPAATPTAPAGDNYSGLWE